MDYFINNSLQLSGNLDSVTEWFYTNGSFSSCPSLGVICALPFRCMLCRLPIFKNMRSIISITSKQKSSRSADKHITDVWEYIFDYLNEKTQRGTQILNALCIHLFTPYSLCSSCYFKVSIT